MKIRYYICGLGYDKNNHITNYEENFGNFDTYIEAYEEFVKLQCKNVETLFKNKAEVYQLVIQLEKCEETDDEINCIDVMNEWTFTNPNFKEDK